MAKYLQCSECGKLAFYYDDFVGTEKPFYKRFMRYPEGDTKYGAATHSRIDQRRKSRR